MKKFYFLIALLAISTFTLYAKDNKQTKQKVILDTDMVEIFDDGVSMLMLATDPNIDLIGVTTVTGNTWMNEGTAFAIRQLEAIKRTDIPVLMGSRTGLRPHRHYAIEHERALYGIGIESYAGSFSYPEPKSWQDVYRSKYGIEPKTTINELYPAAMFIVDQVRKYPGEIIIAEIGPCTNLALAVRLAPDIVGKIKEVVYMGGAFFCQGNSTPNAEFNWWADPEAARIVLGKDFKKQTIISLDICNKIPFTKARFEKIKNSIKNPIIKEMFERNFLNAEFKENPDYTHKIWDVIATALIQNPSLLREERVCPIDICTDFGFAYGQSMAYTVQSTKGGNSAHIVMEVDVVRLWEMIEKQLAAL